MMVGKLKILSILFASIGIGLSFHARANSIENHCLLIGDSQTSSSLDGGFARATINELEERGIRVTSYSMSSTSARHWHSPLFNPLREDIVAGRMRVYPENAVITNLDAHSSLSLFQQIIEHHKKTDDPPNCVIFQLGDNAPRKGEIRQLTRQWQAHHDQQAKCFFVSPTWSEERHPNNQYKFKTRQRTLEMRKEIEQELAEDGSQCQHVSTTDDDSLLSSLSQSKAPYTSDGLHLNIRGGEMWSQAAVGQIIAGIREPAAATPTAAVIEAVVPQVEAPIIVQERPAAPLVESPSTASVEIALAPAAQTEPLPESQPEPAPVVEETVEAPAPEQEQYQIFELVCNSNLNMRQGQGERSALVGKIPCQNDQRQRERVAVIDHDEQTGWFKIVFNGQVAWVSGDYLRPTSEYISNPQIEPETSTAGVLNCRSNLNMRHGPSTSFIISGKIPCKTDGAPTPIEVLGVEPQSGWLLVNHDGNQSFVHPRFVTTEKEITNQISNLVTSLQCQHTTQGCPQDSGTPPRREDCEGCDDPVVAGQDWLPGCEVLQKRNFRDSDQRQLQTCFSSIQNAVLSGNTSRGTAFTRMYSRLNEAEQRFLAMTLTAMGEIPPSFAIEEMQIVMKVIDNRVDYAHSRGKRNANALDVALQPWQFSMYNSNIPLWRTQLRQGSNSRHRANAIRAFIGYQNANFRPPGEINRVYHYHANYVRPNWRNSNKVTRPLVNGVGLRQRGTRHIFYRDIAWSFRHNSWSSKR